MTAARVTIARAVLLAVLAAQPARALTPPQATYHMTARVVSAVDDDVEDVSYLRVRLNVIAVLSASAGAPPLGAGTTVSAIVRDPADRAILRSASPALDLPMALSYFGDSVYEVQSAAGRTAARAGTTQDESRETRTTLLLLGVLVVLSAGALTGLTIYHYRRRGRA